MSKRPARKRTPFVIEPLNWVAPDAKKKDASDRKETEVSDSDRETKD